MTMICADAEPLAYAAGVLAAQPALEPLMEGSADPGWIRAQ